MAITTLKGKAVRSKDIELRDSTFPDAGERLWDRRKHHGFATVPKTMPMLMRALDELSKGKPLGQTYFALFCATWDNGFVRLARAPDLFYASGFTGARGIRGFHERLTLLEGLGFVELQPSAGQKYGLAFLPNPNIVLLNLWEKKKAQGNGPHDPPALAGLKDQTMSAFLERAIDIGANDVTRAQAEINKAKREAEKAEGETPTPAPPKPKRRLVRAKPKE